MSKIFGKLVSFFKSSGNRRLDIFKYAVLAAGAAVILLSYFYGQPGFDLPLVKRPQYVQAYTLVNDKISQDADIVINLPKGEDKTQAQGQIKFAPDIEGVWQASQSENQLVFNPNQSLKLGRYYTVTLQTANGVIGKDFLAVENPRIVNILPAKDSEAHENSKITIIFNRPMVPLTSLDKLAEYEIPVEISPASPGRFKWIGTQTLQFIPEGGLIASANYTVRVKEGFVAQDGLLIEPLEHKFYTRPVRYEFVQEGSLLYNEPFRIKFNQPVDLERIKNGITVEDAQAKHNVDFEAEYGSKKIFNKETNKEEETEDKTLLLVYNKKDAHGRKRFWDFKKGYYLNIQEVYPTRGDIIINEDKGVYRQVTDVIKNIAAVSERTEFARPDFFDSEGWLEVEFYEEIALAKSSISANKLAEIKYGERCRSEEELITSSSDVCQKETDRTKIFLRFDSVKTQNEEKLAVKFKKIKNLQNIVINPEAITSQVATIPRLKVIATRPEQNARDGDLTKFTLCTNTPLAVPAKEDLGSALKVSADYEFKIWNHSILVPSANAQYYVCQPNQFQTEIYYGLMPEYDYEVFLNLTDHFGAELSVKRGFLTGKMPSQALNFHHLQDKYNVTGPAKTILTYAATNMEFVDLNICQLSGADMLEYLEHSPDYNDPPAYIKNCQRTVNQRISLPKRYWIKNYFKVNLKDYVGDGFGHYVLTFSNPNYREDWGSRRQVYERSYLTVTGLSVVEKKIEIENAPDGEIYKLDEKQRKKLANLYWVVDSDTLAPVKQAKIELLADAGPGKPLTPVSAIATDVQGVARAAPIDRLRGAIVSSGKDSAIIANSESKIESSSIARDAQRFYIYTDRPIYRPGQEVQIKGLYRIGYDGNYEFASGLKIPLKIFNSQGQEVFSKELELNGFGTINTTFTLDSKAALGTYRIEAKNDGAFFEVEEYVGAPFKLEIKSSKDEYIAGESVDLEVDADYYFGVPLEGGEVEYGLTAQNYYFDKYSDGWFNFGAGWYDCYYDCRYGDRFILRNKQELGSDGTARIRQKLDFSALFKEESGETSKLFTFFITVRSKNGQSVSAQKSLIVHRGQFYLGARSSEYFAGKNQPLKIQVKSVDTAGQSKPVKDIQFTVSKVDWVNYKRREVDGAYYYKWEKKLEVVRRETIATDREGDWTGELGVEKEGQYEISVQAEDSLGNGVKGTQDLYIYGEGQVSVRPSNDTSLEVITDKPSIKAGQEAKIIITSPFRKAKALLTLERGQIFQYRIVDINQSLSQHKFAVGREQIPNVFVTATLLSGEPDIKYGQVEFSVDTEERELRLAIAPSKKMYLPGENVDLSFTVTDNAGRPAAAELSVAVADLSVLALKGNPKKNPLPFFYGGFPHAVATVSNLKNILQEVDVPSGTKGGGGANPEDLARQKRGIFKDTAFWQAVLRTNAQGTAKASFILPHNLTTWQIEAIGITQDTKIGVSYDEFTARKQIMVTPLKPRFVVPGDIFALGAKIFNQTGSEQKLDVSLASNTLLLYKDEGKKDATLPAGETKTVYFAVEAPAKQWSGQHDFILSASNREYNDTVEQTINITRNDTYEATATAGYSSEPVVSESVYIPSDVIQDKGELTVQNSATLAVFLSDALNSMLSYPYGCSEQVASKLGALAVIKRGLNIKNIGDAFTLREIEFEGRRYNLDELIEVGLTRLYENQHSNGGFGYYPAMREDYYVTIHVANVLKDLQDSDYYINQGSLNRAFDFLNNSVHSEEFRNSHDFAILSAYTAFRLGSGKAHEYFTTRIKQILKDEKLLNEGLSNTSLTYLALLLNRQTKIFGERGRNKVYDILENKISVDSRGAFLPVNAGNVLWRYYDTDIKDTAFMLKALAARQKDNQIMDRILRWLLSSRSKDGSWGTTNNTISVIDAFSDYLSWRRENESKFELLLNLNGERKQSFDYGPENILQQNQTKIPLSDLAGSGLNTVAFHKINKNNLPNNFYYDLSLKYYLPVDRIAPRDEGFSISRSFYSLDGAANAETAGKAKVGDILRGELKIIVPEGRNFVAVEDIIPAGVELVNFNLATEDSSLQSEYRKGEDRSYYYDWNADGSRSLRPDMAELRDDRLFLFSEHLPAGEYTYTYFIRALVPGVFHHLPAVVSEMYFPENFARTSGEYFTISQ